MGVKTINNKLDLSTFKVSVINDYGIPTEIKSEEAFRVPRSKGRILSKNFFSSHGTVVTGEIEKLMIGTGNEVIIIGPTGLSIRDKISSIEIDKKQTNVAIAGEVVGVCLKNSSINDLAAI